jgi:hypothetical protein
MNRILWKKHQDTLHVFYVHHQINIHTIIVCFAYCLHTHTFLNICSTPNHFSLWYWVYLLTWVQRFMCLSSHKTYIQDDKLVEVLMRSMRSRMSFHLYELLGDKILKKIKLTNKFWIAKRSSKLTERIIWGSKSFDTLRNNNLQKFKATRTTNRKTTKQKFLALMIDEKVPKWWETTKP